MPDPFTIASEAALRELARRRAAAGRMLAQGRCTRAEAERRVALWAGIAAWFGASIPRELRPYPEQQLWTDWAEPGTPVAEWRTAIAQELRRAALHQLALAEDQPCPEHLTRARALLALDSTLAPAAGLPPLPAREAANERKVA